MTQFCVVARHDDTGNTFINGPYDSREAAGAAAANLADEKLAALRAADPELDWELDAYDDGVVTVHAGDDEVTPLAYEWEVFTLIPPAGGPA